MDNKDCDIRMNAGSDLLASATSDLLREQPRRLSKLYNAKFRERKQKHYQRAKEEKR